MLINDTNLIKIISDTGEKMLTKKKPDYIVLVKLNSTRKLKANVEYMISSTS